MEIVGHQIDEVQVTGNGGHIVATTHIVWSNRDSGREQQTWLLQFLCLSFESFPQFLEKQHKVLLVIRTLGVLPIHVETIESTLAEEWDGRVDKGLASVSCGGHVLEFLCAKRPTSDSEQNLWKNQKVNI